MKSVCATSAIVFAALGCQNASAQSSVTLYGIIDTGFTYSNNQGNGSAVMMQSSGYSGNRWGLKGSEDIGGNLSAIFVLENGFDPANGKLGQNNRMFGRQVFVGLSNNWGTVALGRQYDFMVSTVGTLTASQQFAGYIGTRPSDLDGLDGAYRTNNSIKYVGRTAGVQYGLMYGVGGVPGSQATASMYAAGVNYANGPLKLAGAFSNYRNPAATIYDGDSPVNGAYTNPVKSPTISGYSSATREQISALGVTYDVGALTVGVNYSNVIFSGIVPTSSTSKAGSAKFSTYEGLAVFKFTPAFRAGASYSYTKSDTAHYAQTQTGAFYSVSKRTSLYGLVAWQHAQGKGSDGKPAVALITLMSPSSTQNQIIFHTGIIHNF